MAKVFNEEIINYLRSNAKNCRYDPKLFQQGQTFVYKQSGTKKKAEPETEDAQGEFYEDPSIRVEPSPEPHPHCQITEEEGATDCLPSEEESCTDSDDPLCLPEDKLKGGGDARRRIDNPFAELTPSQMASLCVRCYGSPSSPIRCILGPFPDEPILSAVDRVLAIVGLTLGERRNMFEDFDEDCIEYIPSDDTIDDAYDDDDESY